MTAYSLEYTQDRNPMVDYATKNMWGNPELDSQYQIKLSRVSGNQGFINDFTYWGKRHLLPSTLEFYHVFSLAGLDIGFWNMGSRGESWYPHNQWIKASTFARNRGINIDVYAGSGSMFVRDETYIMDTFQAGTLLCIPKNKNFPLPVGKNLYMHCYTVDINTRNVTDLVKYSVGYVGAIYQKPADFDRVKLNHDTWKAYNMGQVLYWHNGKVINIDSLYPVPGDMIEASYDPGIEIIASYKYKGMPDYYSELDSKRKVILFPDIREKPRVYRYYDDCIYFVTNRRNGQMYYYNRNSEDAVRQLTHQDYGMAAVYVDFLADRLINEDVTHQTTIEDIDITVAYHKTLWQVPVGPTSSRINDLYLLEYPEDILNALTGTHSAIPEWTANKLENSPTNLVLNRDIRYLKTKAIREGLGYNGCAVAMSNTPLYMPAIPPGRPGHKPIAETPPYETGLGYRIPPTYVAYSTAYEYSEDGLLLRLRQVVNQEWYLPSDDCFYVEWALGKATQKVDYVVSQEDIKIKMGYGFRVYKAPYAAPPDPPETKDGKEIKVSLDGDHPYGANGKELRIWELDQSIDDDTEDIPDGGFITGPWVDITGDETQYEIIDGYVVFRFDTINYMGLVVSDYHHIYNSFELEHLDNSLSFAITRSWTIGTKLLEMEPGQIDIWMNGHPLSENIDYYLDFPNVYITNKMWLKEGAQFLQYRATGLSKNGLVNTSELGIVADAVLGMNGRYNLRIDRPTKTILGGRLFLTQTLDAGEDIDHGRNVMEYNGWPYEVKHIYCANKYVDWYDTYWGYDEARELDKRISDYLTEHVKYKPKTANDTVYMEDDKYRLYSPFLSLIVNELVLGFMDAPPVSGLEVPYPASVVDNLTREHQWLLKYDPIVNDIDLRFFTVQPYNNLTTMQVTPDQLTFIKMVNNLYLGGKVYIEGYFEVKNV